MLILLGSHVEDLSAQGQRVHKSEDAQTLLHDETVFKDGICRDAAVVAMHRWFEWSLHLHTLYKFPRPTWLHGMYSDT